jgi:ketosteroid isomerase-like protein
MSAIDDVKKAAGELVGHFGASRVSEYFQCFSQSADFIFYTHTERLKSRKAYEDLWKTWETEMNFKILSCTSSDQDIKLVGNDVAIFTHNVSTDVSTNAGVETVSERETIVFELKNGAWIAIHEHLSPAA